MIVKFGKYLFVLSLFVTVYKVVIMQKKTEKCY